MTLEHIVNPFDFILKLKNINSRYLFIEVPTLDQKFLNEPFGMFCEEHVNYFTLESLNHMMAIAGYGLLEAMVNYGVNQPFPAGWPSVDTVWELGREKKNLKFMVSSGETLRKYISENQKVMDLLKAKIDAIPNNAKLAVYGTGHHVSMLLSNTSLNEKNIVKFYDGDSRKYKYSMHDRPIQKFEPEDLKSGEVDSILIGSYVYSDELYNIVRPFKENCTIYKIY